jgi:uncharacterized membrane protein YkvA (DUF1232 family)
MLKTIKAWAKRIKRDAVTLWFARKHPQTPLLAKLLSAAAVAYVLSPIDLIPDFIPVLGYLDEVILVPLFIWGIVRLIPEPVVLSCRAQAEDWLREQHAKPVSYVGAAIIISLWVLGGYLLWRSLFS